MIRGTVSTDGVPTSTLSIAGQDWHAIIDTGFNGDLELPEGLRGSLNARYVRYAHARLRLSVGRVTSALAGGQIIEEEVYLVEFPFDGQTVQAEATFVSGSQILIGTHLLREYCLQINFVSRTVQLEKVKPTIVENNTHIDKSLISGH